jgi:hypothetical protein
MTSTVNVHQADLEARFCPSRFQMATAAAMLAANPGAHSVVVPIALPGKSPGWWEAGQAVEYPPGYFLAITNDWDGPESYAAARNEAEAVSERHMVAVTGTTAYASIRPDGTFAVYEGSCVSSLRKR